MLRYMVPLVFVLSSANSWQDWIPRHQFLHPDVQVASDSQIKFALENKYDETGPGAKQPEYAYQTYTNLEDALVGFLDDPDTKLPEHEREKAIIKLIKQDKYGYRVPPGLYQKDERFKVIRKPPLQYQNIHTQAINSAAGKHFYDQDAKVGKSVNLDPNEVLKTHHIDTKLGPFRFQKIHKGIPLSLAHYTKDLDPLVPKPQFDAHPKFMFAYKVHDKTTGDSKTVQESRNGGNVRGFYSFLDSDGKTRTVHYTADDKQGFRANVQKT